MPDTANPPLDISYEIAGGPHNLAVTIENDRLTQFRSSTLTQEHAPLVVRVNTINRETGEIKSQEFVIDLAVATEQTTTKSFRLLVDSYGVASFPQEIIEQSPADNMFNVTFPELKGMSLNYPFYSDVPKGS